MIEFEYGANCQGYWDYDRMVLQVEDCIDVLKTLYADEEYEWYFNFDHSCGHDRQRPDGLSMTKLCKERLQQFNTAGQASKIKRIATLAEMAKRYSEGALDPKIG